MVSKKRKKKKKNIKKPQKQVNLRVNAIKSGTVSSGSSIDYRKEVV